MTVSGETKSNIIIIIPLYRKELSHYEQISLTQCTKVLKGHDIVFVSPEPLDITDIQERYDVDRVERFDGEYFQSTKTYNRLLLSKAFYERFSAYDYILIHQLDAFVFADELTEWCGLELDYVGAPWFGETWPDTIMRSAKKPFWARIPLFRMMFFKKSNLVGNGGFSLRNVASALKVLRILEKYAANWVVNEDVFWAIYVPNVLPFFKIPDMQTAAHFSLELHPRLGVEMNGGALPFGCHAWEKWDPEFWRAHIEARGYRFDAYGAGRKTG